MSDFSRSAGCVSLALSELTKQLFNVVDDTQCGSVRRLLTTNSDILVHFSLCHAASFCESAVALNPLKSVASRHPFWHIIKTQICV